MNCLTNFSSKTVLLLSGLVLLVQGCATYDRAPVPSPELVALHPDKAGPMPARLSTINWTATVTGGSGYITYEFRTMKRNIQTIQQRGGSPVWEWQPKQPVPVRFSQSLVDLVICFA